MHVCMYVCMYIQTYIHTYIDVCVCVYTRVCVYIHTHTHTHAMGAQIRAGHKLILRTHINALTCRLALLPETPSEMV
jgi:hypothetical protein